MALVLAFFFLLLVILRHQSEKSTLSLKKTEALENIGMGYELGLEYIGVLVYNNVLKNMKEDYIYVN